MTPEEMDALTSALQRKLGSAWADMVEWLRRNNKLKAVERAIARGDVQGALAGIEQAAAKFAADVNGAFTLAQQRAARWLDGEVTDKLIRYDAANERAVSWMRQNTLELVRGINTEQRSIIHAAMTDGLERGESPLTIAREIRDSIGLTAHQRKAVRSYRRSLEQGDFADALGRQMADGRYDRGILAAQREGKAIPRAQINRMVERYRQIAINTRAETIARTEAIRSAHQGSHELFSDAVANGDVGEHQLVRSWVHRNRGRNNRDFHHVMNNQRRGLNEAFISGLGNAIMFPGDPTAPAEETINCRCTVTTRFIRNPRVASTFAASGTRAPLGAHPVPAL